MKISHIITIVVSGGTIIGAYADDPKLQGRTVRIIDFDVDQDAWGDMTIGKNPKAHRVGIDGHHPEPACVCTEELMRVTRKTFRITKP